MLHLLVESEMSYNKPIRSKDLSFHTEIRRQCGLRIRLIHHNGAIL